MDKNLIDATKNFVSEIFNEKYDSKAAYHSLEHSRDVAEASEKIGKASDLKDDQLEIVILAAWFHDTGYLFQRKDHEIASVKTAETFLRKNSYPEEKISAVAECIFSTRMGHVPRNVMEKVIMDADFTNLSSNDNLKQADLLRKEMVNFGGSEPTEEEWLTAELKFLLNHQYHTSYARNKLEDKKSDNIKKIRKKLKRFRDKEELISQNGSLVNLLENENDEQQDDHRNTVTNMKAMEDDLIENNKLNLEIMATEIKNEEKKMNDKKSDDKKSEEKKSEEKKIIENKDSEKKREEKKELDEKKDLEKKEVQSVKEFGNIYKLIATNHMRLNEIADRKANIMLTLNGIIISITMSVVASSSESNLRLIIPTSIIIVSCLITIIFAALSTRPKVTSGTVSKEDIVDKKANLLFFGNFSKMEFPDFDWGFRQVLKDQEYLHNSMIVDFYSLGKVLEIKYRYLRICYNTFMIGLVMSVLSIALLVILGH